MNEPLNHPAVWRGDSLLHHEDWQRTLGAAELDELESALQRHRATPPESMPVEPGGLPCLRELMGQIRQQLEHGLGAVLLRGLPVGSMDENECRSALWQLSRLLGTPVSQSATGTRIFSVQDEGFAADDPRFRGPSSDRELSFHTDRCDVIGFLCVRPAHRGGENQLVSSMTLFNEMQEHHPQLLETLCEEFTYLRHTVDSGNQLSHCRMPVFSFHQGHFAASLLRVLIERADLHPDLPSLTREQRLALDTLDSMARRPDFHAEFRLQQGDLLFVNNWVTLHRRLAFQESAETQPRRLLLRVWLAVPNSRPLDPRFQDHFGSTEAGAVRGGMRPLG